MPRDRSQSKRVYYSEDDSPGHFQRPAYFMKQLRDRCDFRTCDIVIILNGSKEMLHSGVAGAHSNKLAKMVTTSALPLMLDMSRYPSTSVRKVIDWMYNGKVELRIDQLADHLRVTTDLGVVFLHRQLEQTLRNMARKGQIVQALNIATHNDTGISPETIFMVLQDLGSRQEKEPLDNDDLFQLRFRAIVAIVSARMKQLDKAPLINLALMWLRHPQHGGCTDDVINQLSVMEMTEADLYAFRMTLTSAMRNPNLRRYVTVSLKNGSLAINIDAPDRTCSTFSENSSLDESDLFDTRNRGGSQAMIGKHYRTMSEQDEMRALPPDDEVFGNPKYHTAHNKSRNRYFPPQEVKHLPRTPPKRVDSFTCWERPGDSKSLIRNPYGKSNWNRSFTKSEMDDIRVVPDLFGKMNHGGRNFTHADVEDIRCLPDMFGREEKRAAVRGGRSYTNTEVEDIKCLPDLFEKKQRPPRGGRSFTNTEVEEIQGIPDLFAKDRRPPRGGRSFTNTEVEEIKVLPDFFGEERRPRRGGRSFTKTEVDDISGLPDVFNDDYGQRQSRTYTKTDLEDIQKLPNMFNEQLKLKRDRSFTRSEIKELQKIPNIVAKASNSAIVSGCDDCTAIPPSVSLNDFDGVKTATSISNTTLADMKQLKTIGKYNREDEMDDLLALPPIAAGGKKDEELPQRTNSAYVALPKGAASNSYYAF